MKKIITFGFMLGSVALFGQNKGLVNDGAYLVLQDGVHLYIDGADGHYSAYDSGSNAPWIKTQSGYGTISLKGNWYNNAGGGNDAFSNDGTTVELIGANQSIGGSGLSSFDTLRLLGTGTKTLDVDTKVGGKSNFNGILSLGDRPLELNKHTLSITNANNNAITRNNGYILSETVDITVVGPPSQGVNNSIVKWGMGTNTGSYTYPFGTSSSYVPVVINKTSNEANTISAATRATSGDDNQPWVAGVGSMGSGVLNMPDASIKAVIDRWWEIVPTDNNLIADLTLSYDGNENTTDNNSALGTFAMQMWDGTNWGPQEGTGVTATSGIGQVTASGVTFTAGSPVFILSSLDFAGALPVALTDFSIVCNSENVAVQWSTGSESNSDIFTVKRSRDAINWEVVDVVDAAGNSNHKIDYEVIDNSNPANLVYYKLVQTDIDGGEKEYGPISSTCGTSDFENLLNVYPNPTDGNFTVEVTNNSSKNEDAIIQVMDISGRMIEQRNALFTTGVNQLFFDAQFLVKGTYILQVISDSDYSPVKIIVY